MTLGQLVTRANLEALAGAAVFRRGEAYFSAGVVERLRATGDRITAKVEGSTIYPVELWHDGDGELEYDCTCPYAADGDFCKHCVAVGLAWLAERPDAGKPGVRSGKKARRDPWRDIRKYLSTQAPEVLIELLLDTAQRDDRLYRSLLLKTERSTGGDLVEAYRKAIDDAARIDDFIDWRESGTFAGNVDEVANSLAELLQPDTAPALVELAEYAIERLEHSLQQVDDSDGEVGAIVERLGELHLKACAMARPEPAALAERLFRLDMTLPLGVCSFDAATYRGPLGKAGLRRYRELAEAEWRKVKPRGASDGYDSGRYRITRIMEQLAEASGNVEELVAIRARDLSSSYRYLAIAETWARARQHDKAFEWAERGLKAFPGRTDNRLRDFLVAAYLDRGRNDEALKLTWIQFEENPALAHYEKLKTVSERLEVWDAQRRRALSLVAERAARRTKAVTRWSSASSAPDCSLRVEIALWEQDLDAAWTAVHEGTCNRGLLVALAGKLEKSRSGDAISLYRRVIPAIVEQTNNAAYAEAISLIRKIARLMQAENQARQLSEYLAELRAQFKPKRNFIKLLDGVGRVARGG
ncbi:MAG: hypothetical protein GEV05_22455 [Betaproteobacteria bacterium]|nr:hypothetical protein [Betaproteobacteria bacterium]